MRFLFRLLSLFALAVAVIMAVIDATRSIATSALVFTPLIESWRATSPGTLGLARETLEGSLLPALWDPVAVSMLSLPGWLVLAALAFIFHALGHRRDRPGASFAATL